VNKFFVDNYKDIQIWTNFSNFKYSRQRRIRLRFSC